MNNEHLKVSKRCATCAYFYLQAGEETLGNCHKGHPTDDNGFPEMNSAAEGSWCGDHTTVEPGVICPDILGMAVPAARVRINAVRTLEVGTITRFEGGEDDPKDKVTEQSPVGGTPVAAYSKIDMTATT